MIKLLLRDFIDNLTGHRPTKVPPTRLMFDGPIGVDLYLQNGQDFIKLFKDLTNLKPNSKILDIGSGIGRKTLPLTEYLNVNGSYEGIEIVKTGVNWCRQNITNKYPNFHFTHADIYNGFYNHNGAIKPSEYIFPFPDHTFDLVIAASVFTHMLPHDVTHYLNEIRRVLKPNGQSFLTYFLINPKTNKVLDNLPFLKAKNYWTTRLDTPEIVVAFNQLQIEKYYQQSKLKIKNIYPGSWSGLKNALSYQDLIITNK